MDPQILPKNRCIAHRPSSVVRHPSSIHHQQSAMNQTILSRGLMTESSAAPWICTSTSRGSGVDECHLFSQFDTSMSIYAASLRRVSDFSNILGSGLALIGQPTAAHFTLHFTLHYHTPTTTTHSAAQIHPSIHLLPGTVLRRIVVDTSAGLGRRRDRQVLLLLRRMSPLSSHQGIHSTHPTRCCCRTILSTP